MVWGRDPAAVAAAAPRIEHASIQAGDLIARMAGLGVVACIQPSFAVTDAPQVGPALGAGRTAADPRAVPAADIDLVEVLGTSPRPFTPPGG